jgi:hypothetical protein
MKVEVLREAGFEEAAMGLSLSFYDHKEGLYDWWTEEKEEKGKYRLTKLAFKGGGHNKAIASMQVWLYIQAARCWWSEFDTYKVGVTANSSSTMHTLSKRLTNESDYEVGTSPNIIKAFNECLQDFSNPEHPEYHNITTLKINLPEGWLQERQICCNYMSLQNIIRQRTGHRLTYWKTFIDLVLDQVAYPELLRNKDG